MLGYQEAEKDRRDGNIRIYVSHDHIKTLQGSFGSFWELESILAVVSSWRGKCGS